MMFLAAKRTPSPTAAALPAAPTGWAICAFVATSLRGGMLYRNSRQDSEGEPGG